MVTNTTALAGLDLWIWLCICAGVLLLLLLIFLILFCRQRGKLKSKKRSESELKNLKQDYAKLEELIASKEAMAKEIEETRSALEQDQEKHADEARKLTDEYDALKKEIESIKTEKKTLSDQMTKIQKERDEFMKKCLTKSTVEAEREAECSRLISEIDLAITDPLYLVEVWKTETGTKKTTTFLGEQWLPSLSILQMQKPGIGRTHTIPLVAYVQRSRQNNLKEKCISQHTFTEHCSVTKAPVTLPSLAISVCFVKESKNVIDDGQDINFQYGKDMFFINVVELNGFNFATKSNNQSTSIYIAIWELQSPSLNYIEDVSSNDITPRSITSVKSSQISTRQREWKSNPVFESEKYPVTMGQSSIRFDEESNFEVYKIKNRQNSSISKPPSSNRQRSVSTETNDRYIDEWALDNLKAQQEQKILFQEKKLETTSLRVESLETQVSQLVGTLQIREREAEVLRDELSRLKDTVENSQLSSPITTKSHMLLDIESTVPEEKIIFPSILPPSSKYYKSPNLDKLDIIPLSTARTISSTYPDEDDVLSSNMERFRQMCHSLHGILYLDQNIEVEATLGINSILTVNGQEGCCRAALDLRMTHPTKTVNFKEIRLKCSNPDKQSLSVSPLPITTSTHTEGEGGLLEKRYIVVTQTIHFELIDVIDTPPQCRIEYYLSDSENSHVADFALPILLPRFIISNPITAENFINIWFDPSLYIQQGLVGLNPAMIRNAVLMVRTLTFGGSFDVVQGIQHHLAEASIIVSGLLPRQWSSDGIRCLMRLWIGSGSLTGMAKLEVKSDDQGVTDTVFKWTVEMLGEMLEEEE
eukprot:GHVL01045052.1.p1 GENE.GHVL01045052.1~~GHVL01045052.1.p1  ORF type:complete len:818 (+),score=177.19 GHVL01045052.1:144-2597(+)